jgi:Questin oxidase-like
MGKAMEDYVFSTNANIAKDSALPQNQQPRMLARFISGILHPFIHAGYGAEFGLPGMMAEGLAQCAVHAPVAGPLVPSSLFDGTSVKESADSGSQVTATVFDILGEVYDEIQGKPRRAPKAPGLPAALAQHAPTLLKHANKWELDADKLGEEEYLNAKIEELVLLVVSIYGVGGWTSRGAKEFRADFFMCVFPRFSYKRTHPFVHLECTSSLHLYSYPRSQRWYLQ